MEVAREPGCDRGWGAWGRIRRTAPEYGTRASAKGRILPGFKNLSRCCAISGARPQHLVAIPLPGGFQLSRRFLSEFCPSSQRVLNGSSTTRTGRGLARPGRSEQGAWSPLVGKEWRERPCKPDSGPPEGGSDHFSGTGVASGLQRPTRRAWTRAVASPSLFGLSPGGVCPAGPVTSAAVRSYRTVSPLPPAEACFDGVGGLFSVALSLASRPVAVSNHPGPWSPDFPPRARGPRRPPGPLTPALP